MARTRKDIVQALTEMAAYDPTLQQVSSSLVGKELLYFGANVIYQLEQAGNALSKFEDLSRADASQLIAYAYTHGVPVSFFKPATTTVILSRDELKGRVFAPFTLKLDIGSASFYNIDFVQSGRTYTFYQGVVRTVRSSTKILDAFQLDSKGIASPLSSLPWRLFTEFVSGAYQSSYVKLGPKAIPASVRVFAQALTPAGSTPAPVFPYTEYNYNLTSPQARLYKVRAGWDRSVNVYFGDSNWAEVVNPETYNYQLYWLEGTQQNFSVAKQARITYLISGLTLFLKDADFEISAFTLAEDGSLAYAKSQIQQAVFESQGLVTDVQIKAYVDNIPSINSSRLSSSLSANGTPQVEVVLKPKDQENTQFGFLQDALYQYGVHGVQYSVKVVSPVPFTVRIRTLGDSGVSEVPKAKQLIEEYCDYNRLTLNDLVSSSILTQYLRQNGLFHVYAEIAVTNFPVGSVSELKLPASVTVGSLVQKSPDGVTTGFDSNGVWRTLGGTLLSIPEFMDGLDSPHLSVVGDYLFLSSHDANYLLRRNSLGDGWEAVDVTTFMTLKDGSMLIGSFIRYSDQGPVFKQDSTKKVLFFNDSAAFREGPGSMFTNLTHVTPAKELTIEGFNAYYSSPIAVRQGRFYFIENVDFNPGDLKSAFIGIDTINNPVTVADLSGNEILPTFALDGDKIIIPYSAQQQGIDSLRIVDLSSNYSYKEYGVNIMSDPANLRPLWDFLSQDGILEFVTAENSFQYQLRIVGDVAQLYQQTRIQFSGFSLGVRSLIPRKLYKVENSVQWVTEFDVQVVNDNTAERQNVLQARTFESAGTVDYATGVIYGVQNASGEDTVSYEVSGTLLGDYTYPLFAGFVE